MTEANKTLDMLDKLVEYERRIYELERRRQVTDFDGPILPVFSLAGSMTLTESPPWYGLRMTPLNTAHCALLTAGSSSTVVTINLNGSALATVTLASSVKTGRAPLGINLGPDEYITAEVTTVGTGAADLTVRVI